MIYDSLLPPHPFFSPNIIGHHFIACIVGSKLFMQHSELTRESISTANVFILLLDEVKTDCEEVVFYRALHHGEVGVHEILRGIDMPRTQQRSIELEI